jgi:hypothetical protein
MKNQSTHLEQACLSTANISFTRISLPNKNHIKLFLKSNCFEPMDKTGLNVPNFQRFNF